jgi:hypothetical protein
MSVLRIQKTTRKVRVAIRILKIMAATYKNKVPSDVEIMTSFESALAVDSRRDPYSPKAEKRACHIISKPRKMKKFPIFTLMPRNWATETAGLFATTSIVATAKAKTITAKCHNLSAFRRISRRKGRIGKVSMAGQES